jgi:hypothetical protein
MKNNDPEGNLITCTFINISSIMIPFFSFNPLSKMYMFYPDQIMFALYPSHVKTINVTTFYEIFDGFHHVTLKFNFTILKPEGVDPRYLYMLK